MEASDAHKAALTQLFRERLAAVRNNDREALRNMLHPQYFCLTYQGKVLDREAFVAGIEQVPDCQIPADPEIRHIEIEGNIATLVAILRGAFRVEGNLQKGVHSTSHTLLKTDGRWLFIASHYVKEE